MLFYRGRSFYEFHQRSRKLSEVYRELRQRLDHADNMISKLKWQGVPNEIAAVNMDVTGVRSSRPVNTLNQMYQLQKWQEMRERTLTEIEKVDHVLDVICQDPGCERYKDVLLMWYVVKVGKEVIAEELGYSHKQSAYELKNKAVKKFAVALFGILALKAM